MTDQQATELSHPRVGAFDDSAPFVATRFPSNFFYIQSAQERLPGAALATNATFIKTMQGLNVFGWRKP